MIRILIPAALAVSALAAYAHAAVLALAAAVAFVYFVSLVAAPSRKCISCRGSKSHGNAVGISDKNFRSCMTCGGKGSYPRLGVKLFRHDVYTQMKDGKHGRFY